MISTIPYNLHFRSVDDENADGGILHYIEAGDTGHLYGGAIVAIFYKNAWATDDIY